MGMPPTISRRHFLHASLGALALPHLANAAAPGVIGKIERQVILSAPPKSLGWFHPRCCMVPGADGKTLNRVLMTLQAVSGSDVFHQLHVTQSDDVGRTWSEPAPIEDMDWHDAGDGMSEGVCDVVPQWHPQTGTVLAMGTKVWYKKNAVVKAGVERLPLYSVRDTDGKWSKRQPLVWDDPRAAAIYSCGSSERLLIENGDVLVPVTFGPKEHAWRSVTTLRCGFDGKTVTVKQAGSELSNTAGRGLLEPSVVRWNGKYYMTIRAEDNKGYVSVSEDGLNWAPATAYQFDNGEPITMYTTQQHWLPHSEALHLVYNRKTEQNAKVMRYRAPLFIAEMDPATLRLRKETEQVLLPLIGDPENDPKKVRLTDNFHPLTVNADESWITVGENTIASGQLGELLIARVHWNKANGVIQ